jgi:hypothetical protein
MSMDGDYQTKDATYDSINTIVIIGIVLLGIAVVGVWFFFSGF